MSLPSLGVSVVIPVHNGEHFVRDAIDSVLAQEGFELDVIVVDNNSTDRTREIVLDTYRDRVVVIEEARSGAASARNAGVRAATGSWLAFLDADDIWLPQKLARQAAAWEAQPDADVLFTWCKEFHSAELDAEQRSAFACRETPYALLTPSSLLMRRETFLLVGALPDISGGEFIAWYGLAKSMGLRELVVPDVLVRRRIHAHNTTRSMSTIAGYTAAAKWLLDRRRAPASPAS